MKLHHSLAILGIGLAFPSIVSAADYEWTFDNGNLADYFGNGTMAPGGATVTNIGFTDGATIPHIGGQTARVLNVPISVGGADGFNLALNASAPNGGGGYINDYTFIFDVYSPGAAGWHALFQTDPGNANDADWYISPDNAVGIAAIGYSPINSFAPNAWHRVTFAASLGSEVKFYIDGTLAFTRAFNAVDGRFALYSNIDAGDDVRLFNEGDTSGNYTHAMYVNSVAFVDRKLTDAEVGALGGPNANGILVPEPATGALLLSVCAGLAIRRRRLG
jgi:hypothetical protein